MLYQFNHISCILSFLVAFTLVYFVQVLFSSISEVHHRWVHINSKFTFWENTLLIKLLTVNFTQTCSYLSLMNYLWKILSFFCKTQSNNKKYAVVIIISVLMSFKMTLNAQRFRIEFGSSNQQTILRNILLTQILNHQAFEWFESQACFYQTFQTTLGLICLFCYSYLQ